MKTINTMKAMSTFIKLMYKKNNMNIILKEMVTIMKPMFKMKNMFKMMTMLTRKSLFINMKNLNMNKNIMITIEWSLIQSENNQTSFILTLLPFFSFYLFKL